MTRLQTETIKVRPASFAGSFYAHISRRMLHHAGQWWPGPVEEISFSCQPKHEGTDLGKAIESMNKRVYLDEICRVQLKPRLLEFLMPDAVPDDHPVVTALMEAAQSSLHPTQEESV